MDKPTKIELVRNLTRSVGEILINDIVADKIPEDWDGIELRRLLAERFQRQVIGTMSRSRKREFENTVLVNNL